MEENSTAAATRTVNEVMRQYDRLGIEGSARLNKHAVEAQAAFEKIRDSGVASMTDLMQAEQAMLESQVALKASLGEAIPLAVTERIESLKLQYIGLTGSVAQFEAAQIKSAAVVAEASIATDRNTIALQREKTATLEEVAAMEKLWAAQNRVSENRAAARGGGAATQKSGGTVIAGAEEADEGAAVSESAAGAETAEGGALGGGLAALGTTATTLALYAGVAAVAGALAEGVKQALSFDAAFTEVTTVITEDTPNAVEVIGMLKKQLEALPPTLGNITELTHGVYQALSAGIPAAEAVELVGKAALFARASLMDQETAVKLITASMNAYGLTAQDVDHVTSALMATIQQGVLRGPELADSLGRVLPVAANLKVSLSDVLGAATALTKGGLSADESMTALRQVMQSIEKPSATAKKAMAELHLSFADIREEIVTKGLGAGLADLGTHIKDNTELTTELFGNIRALTGILALNGPQQKSYAEATAAITKAYNDANLAQIEFNKITASTSGQLKTLGNTISNETAVAFGKLAPIMLSFAPSLKTLIVDSGVLRLTLSALAALLLTIATTLSITAIAVDGLKDAFYRLAIGVVTAGGYIHGLGTITESAKESLAKLHDGLDKNTDSLNSNRQSLKDSLQAFDGLVRGSNEATDSQKAFEAAQLKLAKANDEVTAATKKANDAISEQATAASDAAEKNKLLEAAAKKTTAAMEKYASAHGIELVKQLQDDVTAARQFAEQMTASHQPTATQTAAIINLNIQLSKLKSLLGDKRSIAETLMGKPEEIKEISTQLTTEIKDPMVDAFNAVLAAEQRLGIQGSASLAKHVSDLEQDMKVMIGAFLNGTITLDELHSAEATLKAANDALAASFNSTAKAASVAAAEEKTAGIEGTQILTQKRNAAQAAYEAIVKEQKAGLESANAVNQAELKALNAQKALLVSLGKPVPDTLTNSIKKVTAALEDVHKTAPSLGDDLKSLKDSGEGLFSSLTSSMGGAVQAFESGQKSLGAAVKEQVQSTLEAYSAQMAVQALINTAEGFASLAMGDPVSAGLYFQAAGIDAAAAIAAGAAGMAMGSSGSAGGGSGSPSLGSVSGTTQATVTPTNTVNVARFGSGGLVTGRTLAMIGDSKSNPSQDATEAVLPLDDPQSMAKLRAGLGGSGITMVVQGLISPDNLGKVMDQMSARVQAGQKLVASHANRVLKKS
jgi:TP901 family phage tail tape measure protein